MTICYRKAIPQCCSSFFKWLVLKQDTLNILTIEYSFIICQISCCHIITSRLIASKTAIYFYIFYDIKCIITNNAISVICSSLDPHFCNRIKCVCLCYCILQIWCSVVPRRSVFQSRTFRCDIYYSFYRIDINTRNFIG